MTITYTYMNSAGAIKDKKMTGATSAAIITALYNALGAVKILAITPNPEDYVLATT